MVRAFTEGGSHLDSMVGLRRELVLPSNYQPAEAKASVKGGDAGERSERTLDGTPQRRLPVRRRCCAAITTACSANHRRTFSDGDLDCRLSTLSLTTSWGTAETANSAETT